MTPLLDIPFIAPLANVLATSLVNAIPTFGIAALGLGSAWMLAWLGAASIPLMLHLLHRRRQQEVSWAAMELLMQAIRQNSRTVKIEQWLLLLLRTAVLVMFAFALTRPFLKGVAGVESNVTEPPKLWILALDASYSMNYTPQRRSLWDMATARAQELINQAAPGDAFSLFVMSEPSRAIIAQPTYEARRALDELQRLKTCTDGGADLASCLELISQTLQDTRDSSPDLKDVHIVFLTDLGRDTWQPAINGAERRRLQELCDQHSVRIESFAQTNTENLAVTSFESESPLVLRSHSTSLSATVSNFSKRAMERVPVQFQANGRTLQTEFVDIAPNAQQTVSTELQASSADQWTLSVHLPNDRLAIDNQRHLIVAVRPQLRVVTVEDQADASRLVNLSLSPQSNKITTNATITTETWHPTDLESRSLDEADAIVLVDVAELSTKSLARLQSFVDRGGAVLACLGPQVHTTAWNRSEASLGQMLGFDLREPAEVDDYRIDPLNYASPIAKPFANFLDAGLLTTPIFRYWKITPRTGMKLTVDLGFTNGDPWIVRRAVGNGWFAAMLSNPESGSQPANTNAAAWNLMATWPSFVPIMQRMLETLVGGNLDQRNLVVGQPLQGSIERATGAVEVQVRRPDGTTNRFTVPPPDSGERQTWSYSITEHAGIYELERMDKSPAIHPKSMAVNINPIQSELSSVSASALPSNSKEASAEQAPASVHKLDGMDAPNDRIAQWCLWSVVILLVGESLLAWNMGRRLT